MTGLRGRVYGADLGHGPKPWLVVSDNARNRVLDTVLAVRLTTTNLEHVASAVKLKPADSPLAGWIRVDDLERLYANELGGEWGALSGPTMREVDLTLHQVFGIRWCPAPAT